MITLFFFCWFGFQTSEFIQVYPLSVSDGLSQSYVSDITQDEDGYLWLGTFGGLNKFDGYAFKVFKKSPRNPASISGNLISYCTPINNGLLAVTANDGKLDIFDPKAKVVVQSSDRFLPEMPTEVLWLDLEYSDQQNLLFVASSFGLSIVETADGKLRHRESYTDWMGERLIPYSIKEISDNVYLVSTSKGILKYQNGSLEYFLDLPNTLIGKYRIFAEPQSTGSLWLGGESVWYIDPPYRQWHKMEFQLQEKKQRVTTNEIYVDHRGYTWVLTHLNGLWQVQPGQTQMRRIEIRDLTFGNAIEDTRFYNIFEDRSGLIWFGTGAGVLRYDPRSSVFKGIYKEALNIQKFQVEDDQNMLTSSQHRLLKVNAESKDPEQLYEIFVDDVPQTISTFLVTKQNRLWLAAGSQLYTAPELGKPLQKLSSVVQLQLRSGSIQALQSDEKGILSVATTKGAFRVLPNLAGSYSVEMVPGPAYQYYSLLVDHKGSLWLGSRSNNVIYWNPESNDQQRVDVSFVMGFYQQNSSRIWAASYGEGLARIDIDPRGITKRLFLEEDGLADNAVYAVLEDEQQRLWCATNKGLSLFDPVTETFTNFDSNDGLLSNEFTYGSFDKSPDGRLFFANIEGIQFFQPSQLQQNQTPPKVALTNAWIYDQPYQPEQGSLTGLQTMALDHTQKVVSFQFAALDFTNPSKNQFSYRLEGQTDQWVNLGTKRDITFSRLAPGNYTLEVLGTNNDGLASLTPYRLQLRIIPHPLLSWPAKVIYALLFALLAYAYVQFLQAQNRRELRRKQQLLDQQAVLIEAETKAKVQEQKAREQISKALEREQIAREAANKSLLKEREALSVVQHTSQLKSDFLANTSHELRTPLNGIVGIADSLLEGIAGSLSPALYKNLRLISSSGKRLTRLINDILDFSKMEANRLDIQAQPIALHPVMEAVLSLTAPLSRQKDLFVNNQVSEDLPLVEADEDRLQQILHNLIGNAIKFTHQGGITISAEPSGDKVWIHVEDSGVGIPEDKLTHIFNAFEQVKGAADRAYEGTGLGLAVTKSLIDLLGGDIAVQSKPGEGSRFSFSLPRSNAHEAGNRYVGEMQLEQLTDTLNEEEATRIYYDITDVPGDGADVLVVDDNPINLQVVVNHLSLKNFRIRQASSGAEALELVDEMKPDLVLLDVMMPEMNGYDVCRQIRQTYSADDLPVVLLTAKNQVTDLVQGFEAGANDFLTKPVNAMELFSRLKNHLKLVEARQALFSSYQKVNQVVDEQTKELLRKNESLSERNKELEAHDQIVKVINRQVQVALMFRIILQQCLAYCSHANRGALYFCEPSDDRLALTSVVGFDEQAAGVGTVFERERLEENYMPPERDVVAGMYQLHEDDLTRFDRKLPHTAEMLVLRLEVNQKLLGVIMLGADHPDKSFTSKDMNQVRQLVGHLEIAFIRAHNIREIQIKGEENVRMQRELNYQERLGALGEMTAGVAHEIQNPLNLINNFAMVTREQCLELKEEIEGADATTEVVAEALVDLAENAKLIEHHGKRASKIIREMLSHTRGLGGEKQYVDFNQVVLEHVNMAKDAKLTGLKDVEVEVLTHLAPELGQVPLYVLDFGRAITNLVENAIYASAQRARAEQQRGIVMVSTALDQNQLVLKVEDNGNGIKEEDRKRIFDPFYTTKPVGEGTGLGLSLTHATVVKGHDGHLEVLSNAQGGATFVIKIPNVKMENGWT